MVSGASEYYKGSIVSYDNAVKTSLLGVDKSAIDTHGAVSREVVEQMAQNVSKKLKTDCSIAVSGIAGPDGGTAEKPVGTVWFGLATRNGVAAQSCHFQGERNEIRAQAVAFALAWLAQECGAVAPGQAT